MEEKDIATQTVVEEVIAVKIMAEEIAVKILVEDGEEIVIQTRGSSTSSSSSVSVWRSPASSSFSSIWRSAVAFSSSSSLSSSISSASSPSYLIGACVNRVMDSGSNHCYSTIVKA